MERLLKELKSRLVVLKEVKQRWEGINSNDKYLEGRIAGLSEAVELISQLIQK